MFARFLLVVGLLSPASSAHAWTFTARNQSNANAAFAAATWTTVCIVENGSGTGCGQSIWAWQMNGWYVVGAGQSRSLEFANDAVIVVLKNGAAYTPDPTNGGFWMHPTQSFSYFNYESGGHWYIQDVRTSGQARGTQGQGLGTESLRDRSYLQSLGLREGRGYRFVTTSTFTIR